MAYTPYEWTVNSYLNPTRMNAIEQGIAAASQEAESASGEFHTIEELIGTQSISGIGDGTLTGATWKINNDLSELSEVVTALNSNLNRKNPISLENEYSKIEGYYTKVGNTVTVDCIGTFKTNISSSSGYIQMPSLPTPSSPVFGIASNREIAWSSQLFEVSSYGLRFISSYQSGKSYHATVSYIV